MSKKSRFLGALLGALSLGAATTVPEPPVPAPLEAPAPANPVAKTDGRHTKYVTPKRHGKKWRGGRPLGRATRAVKKMLWPLNHWHRRALTKAASKGRGLAPEAPRGPGATVFGRTVRLFDGSKVFVRSTRRAAERGANVRWFYES